MPLIHRKIGDGTATTKKYESCGVCYFCPYDCTNYSAPPPPPPTTSHHQFSAVLILMITGLALVFLLFSCLVYFRYRSILRNPGRMNPSRPVPGNDGLYENQAGPVMDHHVWHIRTVGLPQSLIDSIPIFDYKRGEKMVEGSDDHCAVCLSEFQDNESLRILPKCSHAFHVVCIDTWLRWHKNCPVCRSPVWMDSRNASVADHSGSIQGPVPELETNETAADTRAVHQNGGGSEKRALRVLSDLSDRRAVEVEWERVRRSVSMDYEIEDDESDQGCSETPLSAMCVNTRI